MLEKDDTNQTDEYNQMRGIVGILSELVVHNPLASTFTELFFQLISCSSTQ